jgi:hypothetical protein
LSLGAALPASPGRYLAETAAIADRDLLLPKTDQGTANASRRNASFRKREPGSKIG